MKCSLQLLLIAVIYHCTPIFTVHHHTVVATDISFLLLTSSSIDFNTTSVVGAVDEAVNDIMADTTLLKNISIHYTVMDTQCNREETRLILQDHINDTQVLAVIGCGCSNATQAINELTQLIPIISYASLKHFEHSALIKIVPSYSFLSLAIAYFVDSFGWKQVLLITEEIGVPLQNFKDNFSAKGITIEEWLLTNKSLSSYDLSMSNKRVVILDTKLSTTISILCQAAILGRYYPGYTWIIVDNFVTSNWWDVQSIILKECTNKQLNNVLNFSITAGFVFNSFKTGDGKYNGYAYDAVWTLAIAINQSIHLNKTFNISAFYDIQFEGVTGEVQFENNERLNDLIYFKQLININDTMDPTAIATFNDSLLLLLKPVHEIWPLGVPSDGLPQVVILPIHDGVFILATIFSVTGMIWAVICLIFVIIWRKAKVVRLTSPNLNYFMIIGAISTYLSIIMYTFPSTDSLVIEFLCSIRVYFVTILGYDICISVTSVKIWRIYYIFVNPKPNKKIPKDRHLIGVVLLFTAIDFLILSITTILDIVHSAPILRKSLIITGGITNETTGQSEDYYIWSCSSGNYSRIIITVWTIMHKFVLHSACIYLSFRIRRIEIKVLNEYKSTAAIAYSSLVFMIITSVSLPLLSDYPNVYALLYAFLLFILVTIFLSLTFIPKMVALCRDPKGEKVLEHMAGGSSR